MLAGNVLDCETGPWPSYCQTRIPRENYQNKQGYQSKRSGKALGCCHAIDLRDSVATPVDSSHRPTNSSRHSRLQPNQSHQEFKAIRARTLCSIMRCPPSTPHLSGLFHSASVWEHHQEATGHQSCCCVPWLSPAWLFLAGMLTVRSLCLFMFYYDWMCLPMFMCWKFNSCPRGFGGVVSVMKALVAFMIMCYCRRALLAVSSVTPCNAHCYVVMQHGGIIRCDESLYHPPGLLSLRTHQSHMTDLASAIPSE